MAVSLRLLSGLVLCTALRAPSQESPGGVHIPLTSATALTGQAIVLPRDLPARANILILGFGRNSQDATTAWEKPIRTQLAQGDAVNFFDMAMLAEVPGLLRPMVIRAIKGKVPDVLKPRFLPLSTDEDAWKRTAGFDPAMPDAAYVLLVDRQGTVHWMTHAPFSPASFAELRQRALALAAAH